MISISKISWLCLFLCLVGLSTSQAQQFPNGKIAAEVNGSNITQSEVLELLQRCYGEEVAECLRLGVIRATLEEMIIFKLIEQHTQKLSIKCHKEDYIEDAERYEKPFIAYYQNWGLKNPRSFLKVIQELVSKSQQMQKKHGQLLQAMQQRVLQAKEHRLLLKIFQEISEHNFLKVKLRKKIFAKYHVDYQFFKNRIVLLTRLRKYVLQHISQSEVSDFISKEKFALSDGLLKISHLYLSTLDEIERRPLPESRQKAVRQRIENIRSQIKPDLSNFSEIVANYSDDHGTRYENGNLGWVPRWTMSLLFGGFLLHMGWVPHRTAAVPEIVAAAYLMPPKQLSQPIKTDWGYHLVVVAKRKNGRKLDKSELRKRARNMLALLKMEKLLRKWLKEGNIKRHI